MVSGTQESGFTWIAPVASFQVRLGMSLRSPTGVWVRSAWRMRLSSSHSGASTESPRNT